MAAAGSAAAAAQAFDTGAYATAETHCVTDVAGGDQWDQLSTVAGAAGARPYVREWLERLRCSAAREEIHFSKARLVSAPEGGRIGASPQPRCSGSYSAAQQWERNPRKARAAHGEQLCRIRVQRNAVISTVSKFSQPVRR